MTEHNSATNEYQFRRIALSHLARWNELGYSARPSPAKLRAPLPMASYILLLLLCLVASGCRPTVSATDDGPHLPHVTASPLQSVAELAIPTVLYGTIQPRRTTQVSFELGGQVQTVRVDVGDLVQAGQVLAELDSKAPQAEKRVLQARESIENSILARLTEGERSEVIAAARAELSRLDAELEMTRRQTARTAKLRQEKAVSEHDYESAYYGLRSAEANRDKAQQNLLELETGTRAEDVDSQRHRLAAVQAQIATMDIQLQKSVLTAPYHARVVERHVDEGTVVTPGQPLFELHEVDHFEARITVPTRLLKAMTEVREISVRDQAFVITAQRPNMSVDGSSRSVEVLLEFSDCNGQAVAGETCTAVAHLRTPGPAYVLPISALVASIRGLWSCYWLDEQGTNPHQGSTFVVHKSDVKILHTDGSQVYVTGEIPPGKLVIVAGSHKIVPGMKVQCTVKDP